MLGAGSSFWQELPPSTFSAGLESCSPQRRLFPSPKADVSGMSDVEPWCKSLEHHSSWSTAPSCTFPPPFPLRSTTERNPITETMALPRSRGFNGHFSLCRKAKTHQKRDLTLIAANGTCGLGLSLSASWKPRQLFQICVWAPKRGASRQRSSAGPAAAAHRRQQQLQSWFENFKLLFFPPFFF